MPGPLCALWEMLVGARSEGSRPYLIPGRINGKFSHGGNIVRHFLCEQALPQPSRINGIAKATGYVWQCAGSATTPAASL